MSTFRIYQHPTQGYAAVKVGFSWPALLFNWIWMFSKQNICSNMPCESAGISSRT